MMVNLMVKHRQARGSSGRKRTKVNRLRGCKIRSNRGWCTWGGLLSSGWRLRKIGRHGVDSRCCSHWMLLLLLLLLSGDETEPPPRRLGREGLQDSCAGRRNCKEEHRKRIWLCFNEQARGGLFHSQEPRRWWVELDWNWSSIKGIRGDGRQKQTERRKRW